MSTALPLYGEKCGMTRVLAENNQLVPVTVIKISDNLISAPLARPNDKKVVLVTRSQYSRRLRKHKPLLGNNQKYNLPAGCAFTEVAVDDKMAAELGDAKQIPLTQYSEGQFVDVKGVSKGKGYAGTIKRYNFAGQDATHGNSLSHRAPGSIGQRQSPGRVFPGKKMSGHMGNRNVTATKLKIIKIDHEKRLMMIRGAVPGAVGAEVRIFPTVKNVKTQVAK